MACVVFGSMRATQIEIEVRRCSTCRRESRQNAGPDLAELGLFNFNNRRIFTHELLNKFTSSMTAHETTFYGFCTVIRRSYVESGSAVDFCGDEAFRNAWFSFTRVQDLSDSFGCEICGPNPKVVIFDGVTAGFNTKHCTSTLRPPTVVQPGAPRRGEADTPVESTALVWGTLRASALRAVRWRLGLGPNNKSKIGGLVADDIADAVDADANPIGADKQSTTKAAKRDAEDETMRAALPAIAAQVKRLNPSLGVLFSDFVNMAYKSNVEPIVHNYLRFLETVGRLVYSLSSPNYQCRSSLQSLRSCSCRRRRGSRCVLSCKATLMPQRFCCVRFQPSVSSRGRSYNCLESIRRN